MHIHAQFNPTSHSFFLMFFTCLFLFSRDTKTAALNQNIFLLEVLMGIILPRQGSGLVVYSDNGAH